MVEKIILDTDIGTNADDAIALCLALKSPEIKVIGVTTVYGNTRVRKQVAEQMICLCGEKSVPVYAGHERTLSGKREIYWTGIEGEGLQADMAYEQASKHAVDYLVEMVMNHPGQLTLVPIGPLTNVAAALLKEPRLAANVKNIVLMGGVTGLGRNGSRLEKVEHNMRSDPEAAEVVFSSSAPITMVGLDVTRQAIFYRHDLERMARSQTPLVLALTRQIRTYMNYLQRDYSYMCDPLAVATLIHPELIGYERMKVKIEYGQGELDGRTIAERCEAGNVKVGLELDKRALFDLLYRRVFA